MKILSITIKNIGPHAATGIKVPDGFTAIVAPNGSGKTFLLEAMVAALWGEFPSRPGSLYDYLTDNVGEIEIVFALNLAHYKVARIIKNTGKTQKQEACLYRGSGHPATWTPLGGPKLETFNPAVNEILGDKSTFLASVFSAQNNAGDLCAAKPAERRKVLGNLLGFALLDEIATAAKSKAGKLDAERQAKQSTYDATEARLVRLEPAISEREETKRLIEKAREEIDLKKSILQDEEKQIAILRAKNESADNLKSRIDEAKKEIERRKNEITRLNNAVELNESLIGCAEMIRKAKSDLPALEAKAAEMDAAATQAAEAARIEEQVEGLRGRYRELKKEHDSESQIIAHAETVGMWEIKEKRDKLNERLSRPDSEAYNDAERRFKVAEKALEDAKRRAALVDRVPCSEGVGERCELLKDALAARDRVHELSGNVAEIRGEMDALKPERDAWIEAHAALVKLNPPVNLDDRIARANIARERVPKIEEEMKSLGEKAEALKAALPEVKYNKGAHAELNKQIENARRGAAKLEALEKAERETPEIKKEIKLIKISITRNEEIISDIRTRLASMTDNGEAIRKQEAEANETRAAISAHEEEVSRHTRTLGALEKETADLGELRDKNVELYEEISLLETQAARLDTLARAFGKTGVQPLLIEQARPHLKSIAADLLETATEGRFGLRFSTQKALKTGGVSETLDIMVSDGLTERDVATFSGGEQKLLRTILRLSLGIFQSQRSGRPYRLFAIDEAFDSLDPANGERMVALLAGLKQYFDQVLCVTHADNLALDADQVIRLEKSMAGVRVA